ncbi:MAG: M17 family peptidase N-terminal domain-containing protein [bacterium]
MPVTLITHKPANTYSGEVLVCFIFSNSRPPKGIAGYVDWIMDGQISDLIIKNKVKGEFCESLLMAAGSKIKARFILIIGAGSPEGLEPKMIHKVGLYTINVLKGLRVSHFGLYPHDLFLSHINVFDTLDELFAGIKEGAKEDNIQISLLSNSQGQEDIIEKWIKDKTFILKP